MHAFRLSRGLHVARRSSPPSVAASFEPSAIVLRGVTALSVGAPVALGQPVALWEDTPVCSGVSGVVTAVCNREGLDGRLFPSVTVQNDGKHTPWKASAPFRPADADEFVGLVRACGIFDGDKPLWKALTAAMHPQRLIVNCVDTEPCVFAGATVLETEEEALLRGMRLLMEYLHIPTATVAVDSHQKAALSRLHGLTAEMSAPRREISAASVPPRYPYHWAPYLVKYLTGRETPASAPTTAVGVLTVGAAAVAAVAHAVESCRPDICGCVTVAGGGVAEPRRVTVPFGTPYGELLAFCGAETDTCISGGPLSGVVCNDLVMPVLCGVPAVLCPSAEEAKSLPVYECSGCGRCSDACIVGLLPWAIVDGKPDAVRYADRCIDCGACTYVCPSHRPLNDLLKHARVVAEKEGRRWDT